MLATLALRALWLARFPAAPLAPVDAEGFHLLARNLLAGEGFVLAWDPPFCPDAIRPPLYPAFIAGGYALLGMDPARIVLLHLLLEGLTAALAARLGRSLAGPRAGALAAWLYALNGSTQRYTGVLFAETLLLPVLAAAVGATVHTLQRPNARRAALTGALWGASILIKPNVLYLAVAVAGLMFISRPRIRPRIHKCTVSSLYSCIRGTIRGRQPGLWFALALIAVLLPWMARNYALLGRWTVSTAFQENLARVSAVATLAEVRGISAEPWTETWEALYLEIAQTAGSDTTVTCAEQEVQRTRIAAAARELVSTHSAAFARAHWHGVARSLRDVGHRTWYVALTGRSWESTGRISDIGARMGAALRMGAVGDALHALWIERIASPPFDAALLWWGLLAGRVAVWWLALRGAWRLRWTWPIAALLLGSVTYLLILPGPIAYDRFYLPAIPIVTALLAVALSPAQQGYNANGEWRIAN